MNSSDGPERRGDDGSAWEGDELERASENVLGAWPSAQLDDPPADPARPGSPDDPELVAPAPPETGAEDGDVGFAEPAPGEPAADGLPRDEPAAREEPMADEPEGSVSEVEEAVEAGDVVEVGETSAEHAPGDLEVPPGYPVLEGEPRGARRAVGIVVSRFNGEVTAGLLQSALSELDALGVEQDSVTVMPVPGAFELPLAAMALAKTRRFACIVALGCVIRGDTPHFDYVASEAASGLQLAAIETGVPVSFGVLTLDRPDQAEPRLEKGAEAVRTALEMADLFANLRAAAAR
jgi:6,7-dimethyl-8-ribityllumazine synthase